jgi:hypothetical protein
MVRNHQIKHFILVEVPVVGRFIVFHYYLIPNQGVAGSSPAGRANLFNEL